jgi:hypothetical protein
MSKQRREKTVDGLQAWKNRAATVSENAPAGQISRSETQVESGTAPLKWMATRFLLTEY